MRRSFISRAVLLGAAVFVSAAGAAWEVVYEAPEYTALSDLDLDARPTGYCVGHENRLGVKAGSD